MKVNVQGSWMENLYTGWDPWNSIIILGCWSYGLMVFVTGVSDFSFFL